MNDIQPFDRYKYFNETISVDPDMQCIFSLEIISHTAFSLQHTTGDKIFAITGLIIIFIVIGPMTAVFSLGYRFYTKKQRELKSVLKTHVQKVNSMLFFVVTLQTAMIVIFVVIPAWLLIFPLVLHAFFKPNFMEGISLNSFSQCYFFSLGAYPIADSMVLLYFIKNYRLAIKRSILGLFCINESVAEADPNLTTNLQTIRTSRIVLSNWKRSVMEPY